MSEAPLVEKYSEKNGLLVQIDHDICTGFADCVDVAPTVFALNDDGLAVVLDPDAVEPDLLKDAADSCPVSAILLFDDTGVQIAPGF